MVNTLVPLLSLNPEPVMVIVAPAFTSVGVTAVIRGCEEDGSVEFVQPIGRIAANNATMDRMQLIVLDGMACSSR
jgi:hypothetical protein